MIPCPALKPHPDTIVLGCCWVLLENLQSRKKKTLRPCNSAERHLKKNSTWVTLEKYCPHSPNLCAWNRVKLIFPPGGETC